MEGCNGKTEVMRKIRVDHLNYRLDGQRNQNYKTEERDFAGGIKLHILFYREML